MRALAGLVVVSILSGCATPQPVRDTAALVGKMSAKMDDAMGQYVAGLKRVRTQDTARIQKSETSTARLQAANEDQLQILSLTSESLPLTVFDAITTAPEADATTGLSSRPAAFDFAPPVFDAAPLKSVAETSAAIADPRNAGEQLRVLLKFAEQVNLDLQKETPATP